jgi:hypothetical protein
MSRSKFVYTPVDDDLVAFSEELDNLGGGDATVASLEVRWATRREFPPANPLR